MIARQEITSFKVFGVNYFLMERDNEECYN